MPCREPRVSGRSPGRALSPSPGVTFPEGAALGALCPGPALAGTSLHSPALPVTRPPALHAHLGQRDNTHRPLPPNPLSPWSSRTTWAAARFLSIFPRSSPGAGNDPTTQADSTTARFPGETEAPPPRPPAGAQSSGSEAGSGPGTGPGRPWKAVPLRLTAAKSHQPTSVPGTRSSGSACLPSVAMRSHGALRKTLRSPRGPTVLLSLSRLNPRLRWRYLP